MIIWLIRKEEIFKLNRIYKQLKSYKKSYQSKNYWNEWCLLLILLLFTFNFSYIPFRIIVCNPEYHCRTLPDSISATCIVQRIFCCCLLHNIQTVVQQLFPSYAKKNLKNGCTTVVQQKIAYWKPSFRHKSGSNIQAWTMR